MAMRKDATGNQAGGHEVLERARRILVAHGGEEPRPEATAHFASTDPSN